MTTVAEAVDVAVNAPAEPPTAPASQGAVTPPLPEPNREERRAAAKAEQKEETARKLRTATFADLKGKKRRRSEVTVQVYNEDGEAEELVIKIRAIGSKEYDKMVADCPPTAKQMAQQQVYNMDEFAPRLITACVLEPKMTLEDVMELYESEEWASGEIGHLFFSCSNLCNSGMNVPFTVAG